MKSNFKPRSGSKMKSLLGKGLVAVALAATLGACGEEIANTNTTSSQVTNTGSTSSSTGSTGTTISNPSNSSGSVHTGGS